MTKTLKLVPVTERALIQRINRKMRDNRWVVKTWRKGPRAGTFYLLDYGRNTVVDDDVKLAALARDLKCLAAWEEVRNEG